MPLSNILDRAAETLGQFLPRLGGALLLLGGGLLVARIVARALARGLSAAGLDRLGERFRVHDALERLGLVRSLTHLLGVAARTGLSLVVVFAALTLLGLESLSASLNQVVLFLPRVLAALALVLAGVVLGGVARERIDRLAFRMDFPGPAGDLTQVVVVAVFGVMALGQVGVPTVSVTVFVAIALGATALTLALAFGLGGRDLARQVSAGRYVDGVFEVGQTITVGEARGEILAIESAATVLRTEDGRQVRVPNHLLLGSVVTVHDPSSPQGR